MTRSNLRYLRLFPKRYRAVPMDCPPKCLPKTDKAGYKAWLAYWGGVGRSLGNLAKQVEQSQTNWWLLTYKDGHKELAYLKYRRGLFWKDAMHNGTFTRGLLLPRYWSAYQFAHVKEAKPVF